MGRLMGAESPVMRFLSSFANLVGVNLLIILFSVPLVTVGAAAAAGLRVTRDIMNGEESHIIRSFWNAFRENFTQATLVWIPQAVVIAGLCANFYLFQFLMDDAHYRRAIVLLVVLLVVVVGVGVYLYMLVETFRNKLMEHLKNALALFFHYLPISVPLACLNALPAVLFVLSPYLFLQTFVIWAGFGFALICLLDNLMLKSVFTKLGKS